MKLGNPSNKWLVGLVTATMIGGATQWEGIMLKPYYDVANVLTVCMGYTGPGIVKTKAYTRPECDKLLTQELKEHSGYVLKCITRPMSVNQYNAFVLVAYNIGGSAFCGANFVKLFNSGNYEAACRGIATHPNGKPAWSNSGGRYWQGLQNRRIYERNICLKGST